MHYVRYSLPKGPGSPCALAAYVAAPAAVNTVPMAVAKAIPSAPMPREVIGARALVAKKAKELKESAKATLDKSAVC